MRNILIGGEIKGGTKDGKLFVKICLIIDIDLTNFQAKAAEDSPTTFTGFFLVFLS